jgi:hypothetical protein
MTHNNFPTPEEFLRLLSSLEHLSLFVVTLQNPEYDYDREHHLWSINIVEACSSASSDLATDGWSVIRVEADLDAPTSLDLIEDSFENEFLAITHGLEDLASIDPDNPDWHQS